MRSRTAKWFECKVRYEQTQENGLQKNVTEMYVVDALSFSEAEQRITEEMSAYISGEFDIIDIKPAPYKEVFFMGKAEKMLANSTEDLLHAVRKGDRAEADKVYNRSLEEDFEHTDTRWYKAKLQFITIDEKTEKEKKQNVTYLVQACSLHNALDNVDSVMKGTMIDYVQANVGETKIIDVFESATTKAAELMAKMAEDLKDGSQSVESIVDKYVRSATPELRQQLIDRLSQMRESGQVPEKE